MGELRSIYLFRMAGAINVGYEAGDKSSEITVMREFIKETELEKAKLTLDAHHCNPETMTQIEQAGGKYLISGKRKPTKITSTPNGKFT